MPTELLELTSSPSTKALHLFALCWSRRGDRVPMPVFRQLGGSEVNVPLVYYGQNYKGIVSLWLLTTYNGC